MSHVFRIDALYPTVYVEADSASDAACLMTAAVRDALVVPDMHVQRIPKLPEGEEFLR